MIIPDGCNSAYSEKISSYCNHSEYYQSDYDSPLVIGSTFKREPIIGDFFSLGNILMFGMQMGGADYYLKLLAQMVWGKHSKPVRAFIFDYYIGDTRHICNDTTEWYYGVENKFSSFLDKIRQSVHRRKSGEEDSGEHKLFIVYAYHIGKSDGLNRRNLNEIFKEDLKSLGIQVVFCAASGRPMNFVGFDDLFDTVIETLPFYSGCKPVIGTIKTNYREFRKTEKWNLKTRAFLLDFPENN